MEENTVMETENVEVIDENGSEINDLVPADELEGTSSNVAVYTIVGGAITAAAVGAFLGGKKLIKKYKEKKLERALKTVADNGYDISEPELIVDDDIPQEKESDDIPEENPKKKK